MRTREERNQRVVRLLPWLLLILLVFVGGIAAAAPRSAGVGSRLRAVLGAGASESAAHGVVLRGTLGQPVVGTQAQGEVMLAHGFWRGAVGGDGGAYALYLPLALRAHH